MKTKWNRVAWALLVMILLCSFALPAAAETDVTLNTFAKYAKVLQGKGASFKDGVPEVLEGKAVIAVYYDLNADPLELSTKMLEEEGDYWMIPEELLAKDIKEADWALLVYGKPAEDSEWPLNVFCFAVDINQGIYYAPFDIYSRDTYIGNEERTYELTGTFAGMDEFVLHQAWEAQQGDQPVRTAKKEETKEEPEEENEIDDSYRQALEYLKEEKYYSAYEAFMDSSAPDSYEQAQKCKKDWPKNGEVWRTSQGKGDPLEFTIRVNQPEDQAIFLRFIRKGYKISYVFIGGSDTVKLKLPAGTYSIKRGVGRTWYGIEEAFGRNGYYETMTINGSQEIKLQGGGGYSFSINVTEMNPDMQSMGDVDSDSESWEDFNE